MKMGEPVAPSDSGLMVRFVGAPEYVEELSPEWAMGT